MAGDLHVRIADALIAAEAKSRLVHDHVYIAPSSEFEHQEHIITKLRTREAPPAGKRMHIGVGGFFNFDIAARTKPDVIFLLDNNVDAIPVWSLAAKGLRQCKDPKAFKAAFLPELLMLKLDNPNIDLQSPAYVADYMNHSAFWLRNQKAYDYLRTMAENGNIMCAPMDIVAASDAAQQIGQAIRDNGYQVDTAYWSNIGQFIAPYEAVPQPQTAVGSIERGMKFTGEKGLFADDSLTYRREYIHSDAKAAGPAKWDGNDYRHPIKLGPLSLGKETRRAAKHYPPYERMLQNISAIGSERTLHMMTSNMPYKAPMALEMSEDLDRYHGIPHYFEGPPRRTEEAWAKREEARMREQQARKDGNAVY